MPRVWPILGTPCFAIKSLVTLASLRTLSSPARRAPGKTGARHRWTERLLARRPTNVVLVAMANKTARVAWALLRHERIYQPAPA